MTSDGVCAIKEEFIVKERNRPSNTVQENFTTQGNEEPEVKKIKLDDGNSETSKHDKPKQKPRGQNKGRPKPIRESKENKPCPSIINVREGETPKSCEHPHCKHIHEPLEFLKIKPKNIDVNDGTCYIYSVRGECPWGISCRFGSKHLTEDGRNIVDSLKVNDFINHTLNTVSHDVLIRLQRRKYDFDKIEDMVNVAKKKQHANKNNETISTNDDVTKKSGNVTDEDIIAICPREKKKIDWKDKLYLAPLTTLGNLPYRRICKEFGADITCGEMALCDSLLKGLKQEWALVKRHDSEDLFGIQICANNPFAISKTAYLLQNEINVDFVDLNLGCPIDLVYKRGAGCGLLLRTNNLETSIQCTSQILSIPFTIKTRTGVYQDTKIAHELIPKFVKWGASMITVHGRSREQRYTKFADWEYIEKCASIADPCPVFGNGDVFSYEDYIKSREIAPHTSGAMIGRGALVKPWIFTEIKEQKMWDISSAERFDILKKYTNYGLEHWGSDLQGVENTRRFLLEWLSFLYRYVPVALLERPPQQINQRPPYYVGRNDLETLMASSNCADWIRISEMLLGPVPEGFNFLPKHKANSYQ